MKLDPISREDFRRLEVQHRPPTEGKERIRFKCVPCGKSFNSRSQWTNHQQSRKHIALAGSDSQAVEEVIGNKAELDDNEEEWEDVDDEDGEALECEACLFCRKKSLNLIGNVKHMSVDHSFFIPDIEYLVDLERLLDYLGHKVGVGRECLWCDDNKSTVRGIQQHMMDKGHCKMKTDSDDGLAEFAEFYDFSSTHPDGDSADPSEGIPETELATNDNMELVLPSGAKVGHRSLAIYYKQSLRSEEKVQKVVEARKSRGHEVTSQQYQLMAWKRSTIAELKRKAKDHRFISKRKLKLQLKQNKLQTHFRAQILL